MADWTDCLANDSPPWSAYQDVMVGRLVALEKCHGVRPVRIGEVSRRFLAKLIVYSGGIGRNSPFYITTNNGHVLLPFFCRNYSIFLLDNI